MTKIAFIGAGSVEFTRNLVGDILAFDELADAEIALHDIDPERLETAAGIVRLVGDGLGRRARVTATLDRGVASLREHRVYLDGLGYDMDPDEFLRGNATSTGAECGVQYAVDFELVPL